LSPVQYQLSMQSPEATRMRLVHLLYQPLAVSLSMQQSSAPQLPLLFDVLQLHQR